MHDGWLGLVHRANPVSHALAAGTRFGALVPLLATMILLDGPLAREAATALRRFSTVGHAVVAPVPATGALDTALVIEHRPAPLASPNRALPIAKIALVAARAGFAIFNRTRFVPELRHDRGRALTSLHPTTCAEIATGLGALALVAVFGPSEPW